MKKRRNILLALDWYHPKLHQGIAHFAREHHWHLNTEMARRSTHIPIGWQGDGVLTQLNVFHTLREKIILPKNCVFFNHNSPELKEEISVSDNHQKIAEMAAEHFLKLGFKNFASYCPSPLIMGSRVNYFQQRIATAGFESKILLPKGENPNFGERHQYLTKELKKLPKPIAIFSPNDEWAAEVIEVCMDSKIKIPEEIAVLGVRNDELICEALHVPLSSVENNLFQVGYQAASLLERKMNGEKLPTKHYNIAPKEVVVRQSTNIDLAVYRHPDLGKILQYIERNFQRSSLDCEFIAKENGMSLRRLYNIFTICDKESPGKILLDKRLQHASQILQKSNSTIEQIAEKSGFKSSRTFYQAFKKKYQITPNQYRKNFFLNKKRKL